MTLNDKFCMYPNPMDFFKNAPKIKILARFKVFVLSVSTRVPSQELKRFFNFPIRFRDNLYFSRYAYSEPNVVDFIFTHQNEPSLSKIIAYFLDPNANHGFGYLFWNIFIKRCLPNHREILEGRHIFNVKLEKPCGRNNKREIDIAIDLISFGIGIEIKPWRNSSDQDNQLRIYINEYYENRYRNNYLFIYWSYNGRPPSENSIPREMVENLMDERKFIVLSIREHLIPLLCEYKEHIESHSELYVANYFLRKLIEDLPTIIIR